MKPLKPRNAGIYEILRAGVDVTDVVDAAVGEKIYCINPEHEDVDPPDMHVYEDHVHCFVCEWHGDVISAWGALHGIEGAYEAAQDLARAYNIEVPEMSPEARERYEERRRKEEHHAQVAAERHGALMSQEGAEVRAYLLSRGFTEEHLRVFQFGMAPGRHVNIPFKSGTQVHGQVIRQLRGLEPKYVAPKAEDFPLGRRPLYMPRPSRPTEYLLVEGYLDAPAAEAMGIPAIGLGAARASKEQIRDLRAMGEKGATFVYLPDNDEAGLKAGRDNVIRLYPYARLADPVPEGKDVGDLFQADPDGGAAVLRDLMEDAQDGLELALADLPQSKGRREKIRHIKKHVLPLIMSLPDASEQKAVLTDVAETAKLAKDILTSAKTEYEAQHLADDTPEDIDELPEAEWAHLLRPGVLNRYVKDSAKVKGAVGDMRPVKVIFLSEVGAQLDLYPNGTPYGASVMLTGPAGVGKNFAVDTAVALSPEEFYLPFEVASSQAFYYAAKVNPEFLKYKFLYPNEVEAVDTVIDFLRPMLTKAAARKFVTDKDSNGAFEFGDIYVEGPITGVVPTVRNKLEGQFQSRLLVVELSKQPGQIAEQTGALSSQLSPKSWVPGDTDLKARWQAALRSLTGVRKVVADFAHWGGFRLRNEELDHGARLWRNLLGLVVAHAWLEQRNREIRELPDGSKAVVAIPADYRAAYNLFKAAGQRSVIPLGETHIKILEAVHELKEASDYPKDGFTTKEIAEKAGISKGTVSKNRAYLTMSVGLLYETEDHKLAMSDGVGPADWSDRDPMQGFPTPAAVMRGKPQGDPSPPRAPETHETRKRSAASDEIPHRNGKEPVSENGNTRETVSKVPLSSYVQENPAVQKAMDSKDSKDSISGETSGLLLERKEENGRKNADVEGVEEADRDTPLRSPKNTVPTVLPSKGNRDFAGPHSEVVPSTDDEWGEI